MRCAETDNVNELVVDKMVSEKSAGGGTYRNQTIDIIKAISAFFVVLIHFPFPGVFGEIAVTIGNFAVPFFFMCSGYYCFQVHSGAKIGKKIAHIAKLALLGCSIYGLYDIVIGGVSTVIDKITVLNIGKWILFNVPFIGYYHLWFLYALIYTYLIWLLMSQTKLVKYSIPIAVSLLFVRFAVYDLLPFFTDKEILPLSLGRSAWLIGIPFFLIGTVIHGYLPTVEKLKTALVVLCVVLGTVLSVFIEFSLGGWIIAIGLFLLAVKRPCLHFPLLSKIGKDHSMLLYIMHPLIGDLFLQLGLFSQGTWRWFMPFAVTAATLLFSVLVFYISKKCMSLVKKRV